MSVPEVEYTDELHAALIDFERQKANFVAAGIDAQMVVEFIDVVRRADAELIAARHTHRNSEFYPYYPESFQAEEDGLEDAEKLLRSPLPEVQEKDREIVHAFPPAGSGITPCCGRTPFELPRSERMTQVAKLVTCTGTAKPAT